MGPLSSLPTVAESRFSSAGVLPTKSPSKEELPSTLPGQVHWPHRAAWGEGSKVYFLPACTEGSAVSPRDGNSVQPVTENSARPDREMSQAGPRSCPAESPRLRGADRPLLGLSTVVLKRLNTGERRVPIHRAPAPSTLPARSTSSTRERSSLFAVRFDLDRLQVARISRWKWPATFTSKGERSGQPRIHAFGTAHLHSIELSPEPPNSDAGRPEGAPGPP